jgi:exopolyphosphatase/guanosine-5'-triphosphate,3'-diphosphate pyrophosphatase
MPGVVPRWEWRVFGERFPVAEDDFGARTPTGVQDSDELYLLAPSGDNVKIRDDLLDIKQLQEVDADGLQRWSPILKASFPLSAEDAATASRALGLASPPSLPSPLSLQALLDAHGVPAGPVRPVRVHKHRVRYTVGGCMAEVSDIDVDGRPARTVAVEGEDKAAVLTTVRSMGLGGYRNTSYPDGLKEVLDDGPLRAAVIDVGTNSVKLCVGERTSEGVWRFLADASAVTRLGEGLAEHGGISDSAVERTILAIEEMVATATRLEATAIVAFGTAGLRTAANAGQVIARITARTGIRIEVVGGEEESRLAFLGVMPDLEVGEGSLVVFDTGGGSTQFTFGHGRQVDERFSLPVGAVRFTERFGLDGAVSAERLREARIAIRAELAPVGERPRPDALVGIGGAVTNLVAVQLALDPYDPEAIRGTRLEADELERQIERYRGLDADARRSTVGLQPGRGDVILAGACIVRAVMDALGWTSLVVSDRGLRHGALLDRFGKTRAAGPGSASIGGRG